MKRIVFSAAALASFAALLAQPVSAQRRTRPAASFGTRDAAPVLQTITVDIASAFQQHYRATIEPLVFGRFSIGLSGEYTTDPAGDNDFIAYPADACSAEQLCGRFVPTTGQYAYDPFPYGNDGGYRAWSFNVHGRWYPQALSFSGVRQSASFYVGEFIGYHERRTSQTVYYGCPTCYTPPPQADSTSFRPQPVPGGGWSTYRQTLRGWEPGVEFGVRVLPMRHVVLDVGGRFRLARLEDYQSGTRPGGVDKRLVVSAGVGW